MKRQKARKIKAVSSSSDLSPVSPGLGDDRATSATDAVVVFTADRADDILAKGGSGEWVLNVEKASEHRYLVCCRKSRWDNKDEGAPNRATFLIGIIKGFVKGERPTNRAAQYRYRIELSHYALLQKPNVWNPTWRNPVGYVSLKEIGIDPKKIKFEPMAARAESPTSPSSAPERLTIAQAKKALAATFGVRPEDIEINIRG